MRLIGDVPIYVAPGGADHVAHPELFRTGVQAGAPPDLFTDKGQLWGNPIYDWPRAAAPRLPLVDRALPAHVRALRPRPHRPLPRLHGVLVGARGRVRRPRRALGARARPRGVRRRRRPSSKRLPLIAEDLGVITPRGAAPARRPRPARDGRAAVRLRPRRPARPPPPREPPRRAGALHRHARQRHAARLGRVAGAGARWPRCARRASGRASRGGTSIEVGMGSRARLFMLQAQDVLGLGIRGAHEHARARRRAVALADGRRRADARDGAAPARADRGGRAHA